MAVTSKQPNLVRVYGPLLCLHFNPFGLSGKEGLEDNRDILISKGVGKRILEIYNIKITLAMLIHFKLNIKCLKM